MSNPSIAVFGGTGFIGRNFALYAAQQGSRVVACGRSPQPMAAQESAIGFAQMDATDPEAARKFLRETVPQAVVFCISRTHPRAAQNADPSLALTELRALMNVLQASHECGVKQLVFCSSGGAVYGDGPHPHRETDPCRPKSVYGQLKIQGEALINELCPRLGIRAAILRIGNPYGPHQSPFGLHGVISIFMYKMLTNAPITVMGSLDAAKDYIFIDDLSAAIWSCIEREEAATLNIASGTTTTVRTLIEATSRICEIKPNIEYREINSAEVTSFALNIDKAREELNWRPQVDLDTGIRRTKAWIEKAYALSSAHG